MASNVPISGGKSSEFTAPTPQNTPLNNAPLTREALSRPTVGTIGEEGEETAAQDSAAAALQANPALAGLIQNKLSGLVGRSSGYIESLPPHIKRRVEGLKGVHVDHTKIEAEFQKEILELEKKYAERYRPLYQRRAAIVQGQAEPSEEEVKAGEASAKDDDDDDDEEADGEEKQSLASAPVPADAEKGIPEFWLTALKNHVALSELITERDEEALRALIDIRMSYLPGSQAGFKLEFEFDSARNTFFKNKILTKTYFYQDEVGFSGDLVYDHAEGDKIEWLEDKDLTHRIETKKQRNKNTNQTRTVKRSVPVESFFNFFTPPKPPKAGAEEEEEEEADFEELDERLELDYQIGEDLKDRIIPHSILYFTGEATAYEMDDDDFEDEFDEDDEDEDDEDEDGQQRPANMAVSAGSQADQQECKQQ